MMTQNRDPHPVEAAATRIMADFRARAVPGPVVNDAPIVPGLFLSWDAGHGDVVLELGRANGAVRIAGSVDGAPRWITLNLDLGRAGFGAGEVLVVIGDITGRGAEAGLRLRCRSHPEHGGMRDTLFDDVLFPRAERLPQAAMQVMAPGSGAWGAAMARSLILYLPEGDFALTLHDLRLFVSRAGAAVNAAPPTLGSFANF